MQPSASASLVLFVQHITSHPHKIPRPKNLAKQYSEADTIVCKMLNATVSNLCELCSSFDVRGLLLEAKAQGQPTQGSNAQLSEYGHIHAGVPRFFEQHKDLTSLKESAQQCALCAAIWDQYSARADPHELTDTALKEGLGVEEIYLGSTVWVEELNGLPCIAAFQYGKTSSARTLAWFEAFAGRGKPFTVVWI